MDNKDHSTKISGIEISDQEQGKSEDTAKMESPSPPKTLTQKETDLTEPLEEVDKDEEEGEEVQTEEAPVDAAIHVGKEPLQLTLTSPLSSEDDPETNENNDSLVHNNKDLPRWYPKWRGRPIFYGTPEALGWACSCVGQATILIGIGAFISPALVNLAKLQAGCEIEAPPGEDEETYVLPECHGTVYGIKPSSLLTIMGVIVGISSAFIIPIIGAVVDFTDKRRYIGRWCSVLYSGMILTLAFLYEDSWFALSIILLIVMSVGWAQNMLFFAYLPELTDNESRLNDFSKAFTVLTFTSMVLYLAVVVGISVALGFADDDAAVARCSAVVAFVLSSILFYISWGLLFQPRPAAHELPEGQSLLAAGFHQVYRTTIKIYTEYKALKWFFISICFGDAAIQSLSVIAITFITDQLELSAQEVASAALLMLLGSIPGAVAGAWVNRKFNPVRSSSLAVLGMIIGTTCAAIILKEKGQQVITYIFAALWGVGTGWKYTGDRVLAAALVPGGQDTELMGFYIFCGQVFSWVPSLVFTVLNEAGVSQRIGLATLNVVFLGALLSYCMIGDYGQAVQMADRLRLDTISSVPGQAQPQQSSNRDNLHV